MRKGFFCCVTTVCCFVATSALANDGRVSDDTLSAMGLSGLDVISDADASSIRGMGYFHVPKRPKKSHASAWGNSMAYFHGHGGKAIAKNGYKAGGKHFAEGGSASVAGLHKKIGVGYRRPRVKIHIKKKFFAHGTSWARAR